jgi:hypothetical protein
MEHIPLRYDGKTVLDEQSLYWYTIRLNGFESTFIVEDRRDAQSKAKEILNKYKEKSNAKAV